MEHEAQIFEHDQFGSVRVVMIDGEPWFVAADVARNLGYSNPRKAVKDHVYDEDKNTVTIRYGIVQGNPNMTVINESGMYALIFGSKLPAAKEFKHWVTFEVLPAIRKYGYYSIFGNETAPVPAPMKNARSEAQKRPARVYAAEMSNGLVKIGNSSIVRPRVAKIKRETKSKVVDIYISPLMTRENARLIEWACQKNFSSRRVEGEFFSAPFEEVCTEINCMVNIIRADIVVDKKIN